MRRYIAAVIAASVCSLQAHALAFHVHAADSGTSHHTHAPAIHDHPDEYSDHDEADRALHITSVADAASGTGTVITVMVPACAACETIAVDTGIVTSLRTPELRIVGEARAIEVRSHGPPLIFDSPLRGPPTSLLF